MSRPNGRSRSPVPSQSSPLRLRRSSRSRSNSWRRSACHRSRRGRSRGVPIRARRCAARVGPSARTARRHPAQERGGQHGVDRGPAPGDQHARRRTGADRRRHGDGHRRRVGLRGRRRPDDRCARRLGRGAVDGRLRIDQRRGPGRNPVAHDVAGRDRPRRVAPDGPHGVGGRADERDPDDGRPGTSRGRAVGGVRRRSVLGPTTQRSPR